MSIGKLLQLTMMALMLLSGGCATLDSGDDRDPIENLNRKIFNFNEKADNAVFKPVARGYQAIVPDPVDRGVSNVFSNIEDVATVFNDLLQIKVRQGGLDSVRFVVNSTVGLLGLIDVASDMGLPKHREDFGQTLGYWGMGSGPYLVLPFLGPSTLRDTVGLVVDRQNFDPINDIDHTVTRNSLTVIEAIDRRADLLGASNFFEKAALDRYSFLKEAYFQRRQTDIADGGMPFPEFQ